MQSDLFSRHIPLSGLLRLANARPARPGPSSADPTPPAHSARTQHANCSSALSIRPRSQTTARCGRRSRMTASVERQSSISSKRLQTRHMTRHQMAAAGCKAGRRRPLLELRCGHRRPRCPNCTWTRWRRVARPSQWPSWCAAWLTRRTSQLASTMTSALRRQCTDVKS